MQLLRNAFAAVMLLSLTVSAQQLEGVKICIDPGHGGYEAANDRFIPQTGFWESLSNWVKALHLKPMLEEMGATVILTRDGNENNDDLALSQRVAVANNNNVDFMHSIHSNGWQGQSNYTLMLYQGYDSNPTYPGAKTAAARVGNQIYKSNRTTFLTIRGDFDFYGTGQPYLGIFRNLNMPGHLSEGSFHDYIPESFRLLNDAYKKHEAVAITRGLMEYFNAGTQPHGVIAGILRASFEGVDYYYLPGTADGRRPLNNCIVTLEPGGRVYYGDDNNNGFFLFDSLEPGEYTLTMEAEDYAPIMETVTVSPHATTFADGVLALDPNYDAPKVVSTTPQLDFERFSLEDNIIVEFDIRMNTGKTVGAFSITPEVTGEFTWEDNWKRLVFNPNQLLSPGTTYTVSIAADAQSSFGTAVESGYQFSFTTRSKLTLLGAYPEDGATGITPWVEIRLDFDGRIKSNTLPGNIELRDEGGRALGVNVDPDVYDDGAIHFWPLERLENGKQYTVVLKPGVGDKENLLLGEEMILTFSTTAEGYAEGTVVDDFETVDGWSGPVVTDGSLGLDEFATSFSADNFKRFDGSYSGNLSYRFLSPEGVAVTLRSAPLALDGAASFGVWVFGDVSGNQIRFHFTNAGGETHIEQMATLDWAGWKMVRLDPSALPLSEPAFHGFSIARSGEAGGAEGAVFVDNAQTDVTTPVLDLPAAAPADYALEQNYPNPFNPQTSIAFHLPEAAEVSLVVYDVLGREVASLISGREMAAGTHAATWNGKNSFGTMAPSGIYFYRLKAGSFEQTRKMTLLK